MPYGASKYKYKYKYTGWRDHIACKGHGHGSGHYMITTDLRRIARGDPHMITTPASVGMENNP